MSMQPYNEHMSVSIYCVRTCACTRACVYIYIRACVQCTLCICTSVYIPLYALMGIYIYILLVILLKYKLFLQL